MHTAYGRAVTNMSIKIAKAEYEALPDSVKPKFTQDGDAYVLQEEDVEGLKKSKAEILEEKKKIQAERDELAKFKAEKEAEAAKNKQSELEAKGEYEKALAEKEKAWAERYEAEKAEKSAMLADVHRERLENELIKRGALPDRASYLVGDLIGETELFKGENGRYAIKKKGGIGDAAEFDGLISGMKESKGFFFQATNASGSGASGSQQQSSGGSSQWTRAQWDSASTQERTAFTEAGGKITAN